MPTVQEKPRTKAAPVARRTLLAAAAASVCGAAGVIAAPRVVPAVEQHLKDAALDAGVGELEQLEGVSIDAAIRAAELTRAAVEILVMPLARLVATLGSGALTVLLAAIDTARDALGLVHLPTTTLDQFRDVVVAWRDGTSALPVALDAYLTADITSAETYLKALKRRMAPKA